MEEVTKKKSALKVPNSFVIVMGILILVTILTYVIPAGQYDMVQLAGGQAVVDPTSFHFIERTPTTLMQLILAIPRGLVGTAGLIFPFLVVGGCFQFFISTGCFDAALGALMKKLRNRELLVYVFVLIFMGLLGIFNVAHVIVYCMVPVTIIIAKRLHLDPICACASGYFIGLLGFAVTPIGTYNTLVAQQIAGVPLLSGLAYRCVIAVICMSVGIYFCFRYARKVHGNPAAFEIAWQDGNTVQDDDIPPFTWRHQVSMLLLVAVFAVFTYGVVKLKWDLTYFAGLCLPIALICGLLFKKNSDEMVAIFLKGANAVMYGAMLMGMARGIFLVISEASIIHTIIYYASKPLQLVPPAISAMGMFVFTWLFNFLIPSASGKAVIVMPIMAPLADVVGVSRQVSVLAYQYGDGLSNFVNPAAGDTMFSIALCGIPFTKWCRWLAPLCIVLFVLALIFVGAGVLMGWS